MLIFGQLLSALVFGLAANIDNLTIGIAYGTRKRRIALRHNAVIALITTIVTLAAMGLGREIRDLLPPPVPDLLGGTLLLTFAVWNFFWERIGASDQKPASATRSVGPKSVGMAESLFLAFTLSINNVGLAIAGGIGGVSYVWTALSTCSFSIVLLGLGQALGSNLVRVRPVAQVFRHPASGNAVLALAGVLMLSGW